MPSLSYQRFHYQPLLPWSSNTLQFTLDGLFDNSNIISRPIQTPLPNISKKPLFCSYQNQPDDEERQQASANLYNVPRADY